MNNCICSKFEKPGRVLLNMIQYTDKEVMSIKERFEYRPNSLDDPYTILGIVEKAINVVSGRRVRFHTLFLRKDGEGYQHYGIVADGKHIPIGTTEVRSFKEGDFVRKDEKNGSRYEYVHTHNNLGLMRHDIGGIELLN
jgi:hypothetical protein